jgi:uncharacterized protein YjbI with pentapeptide repeats
MSQTEPHRPTSNDDRDGWKAYWAAMGMPWRTEPEIDKERQQYLAERRAVQANPEQGAFPFKDATLTRADVEWLLATHESGAIRGPVDWNDRAQRTRQGLDLRGANLDGADLRRLPLARTLGGVESDTSDWKLALVPPAQFVGAVRMNRALLAGAHLEGAELSGAGMRASNLLGVRGEHAHLRGAHMDGVLAMSAQLQHADLSEAWLAEAAFDPADMETRLDGAHLLGAHLDRAYLNDVHLEGANLSGASLRGARMVGARLAGASLRGAHLEGARLASAIFVSEEQLGWNQRGLLRRRHAKAHVAEVANLTEAFFDTSTDLYRTVLGRPGLGGAMLADVRWGGVNLARVNWSTVLMVGEEQEARAPFDEEGKKSADDYLLDHDNALRATRQLAVVLQAQGLDEIAARFAFRARVLRRRSLWYSALSGHRDTSVDSDRRLWVSAGSMLSLLGAWFLELTSGYGYKPFRSAATYLLAIVGFAALYFAIGIGGSHELSWNQAVVVSMTAFHGRGFFSAAFQPGDPQAVVAAVEALLGLLIEITFIATFTQRFFAR